MSDIYEGRATAIRVGEVAKITFDDGIELLVVGESAGWLSR